MNKKVLLSFLIIFCALFLFSCSANNNDTAVDDSCPVIYEEHLIYQNEIEIYGKLYKPENYVEEGKYPNDIEFLSKVVEDISYNNAVKYFGV